MDKRTVHIVSFDIPSPPDYGGVIDVYYKIRSLVDAGVEVVLHAFEYGGREVSEALREMCSEVYIYRRKMNWNQAVGTTPYIMASRNEPALIRRLERDRFPVLLEGMHTGMHLGHPVLNSRRVLLRMHNIEWNYYRELCNAEKAPARKLYYFAESVRLKWKRSILGKADKVLVISRSEKDILEREFGNVEYLPAFHPYERTRCKEGRGAYALYHGNLSVAENRKAVEWLVDHVFKGMKIPLKVAGNKPPADCISKWSSENIEVIADPDDQQMQQLIKEAQMHVLPTFQSTGLKLKLLNALFNGRHVLVTLEMTEGTRLEGLCHVAGNAREMRNLVKELWEVGFTNQEIQERSLVLGREYNNKENAARLIEWLYPHP